MNITLKKENNEVSLVIESNDVNCAFTGLSRENLKKLRVQIDEILEEPKATVRVWNPRSRKHDIVEQ